MISLERIGQAIRTQRKALHFSQEEAAKRIGIEPRHIDMIERSEVDYPMDLFIELCDVLEIRPQKILEEAQEE